MSGIRLIFLDKRVGVNNRQAPKQHQPEALSFSVFSQFSRHRRSVPDLQPFNSVPTLEISIRMAVYALADGTIIVYNPIAPTEETLREIEDAFGQPGESTRCLI